MGDHEIQVMNSVTRDLTFIVETMGQFQDRSIPTLDFSLWIWVEEGRGPIKYFSKTMASRYLILEC